MSSGEVLMVGALVFCLTRGRLLSEKRDGNEVVVDDEDDDGSIRCA